MRPSIVAMPLRSILGGAETGAEFLGNHFFGERVTDITRSIGAFLGDVTDEGLLAQPTMARAEGGVLIGRLTCLPGQRA